MSTPNTLYDYYTSLGVSLPSISERAVLFENLGLGSAGSYSGTASQNTALLSTLVQQSMPTNEELDQSLAMIEPYVDVLKSITIGDVLTALDQVTAEELFSALLPAGISIGDYTQGLAILQGYPASATLYDVFYSLIQEASGASWGSYSENVSYEFPIPDQVSWSSPSGDGNGGRLMSKEYSITSQGWSLSQAGDLSGVSDDVLSFVKGPALDSLWTGLSQEASNIIVSNFVKPSVSPQLFNLLTHVNDNISDTSTLNEIFQGWLTSTMDSLSQGFDAVENDGRWDDSNIWSRTHQMKAELEQFAIDKVGSVIGSPITQYMRVFFQHSNLQLGIDDSNKSGAFIGEDGHRYAVIGASSGDYLQGASGNDVLIGQSGDDHLSGNGGDDYLAGHEGHDIIDGGTGTDTVNFDGVRASFTLQAQSGTIHVNKGTVVSTSLTNVERLQFADTSLALDIGGIGGQAYRIYQAAFDRAPDKAGLGYWIAMMDKGASLTQVAQGFVNSGEFKALYGAAPTNAEIITRMYKNVLHREAEKAGFDYWLGILDNHKATVVQMLASFSESPENQAGVIGIIGNGFEYAPYG